MNPEGGPVLLVEANPEQARERSRATHEAWGGELTVDGYVALEARLRAQPWPRETLSVWLLCADGGEVLASCESYRMPSRLGPDEGYSYGIASVYTEPSKRRHGHATELLSRLGARLAETDRAQAMVLFSDVALRIYRKSGFAPRPALNLAYAPLPGSPRDGVDELVPEHLAAQALAALPPPRDRFAIRPVPAQLDWHLERERIFSEVLGLSRPQACGARLGAAGILWAADPREGELSVLLLHAPAPAQARALVTCARRVAHAAGLTRVILWKTPLDRPGAGAMAEDRLDRLDSVPMIRPLDPRLGAADWNWIPRVIWV
jgi:GNAT superfamily N-acetyltransferase